MATDIQNIDITTFGQGGMDDGYLSFNVGRERYGLHILDVREVISLVRITRVPGLPVHVKGVVNLRGKVVPVMDLRIKFNCADVVNEQETCIIVVDVDGELVGMIVDSVANVLDLPDGSIDKMPRLGSRVDTEFIQGTARDEDEVIYLLDTRKVLSIEYAES